MGRIQKSHSINPSVEYIPRGRTVLHTILDNHFNSFVENYEVKYAEECGRYSLERITSVIEEYWKCGDFKQGIARVKCTNPECNPGRSRTSLFFAAPVQSMYIGRLLDIPVLRGIKTSLSFDFTCYILGL